MRGLMISSTASGGGKTVLTCGIMAALGRRGMSVAGFKCGPDYIDPMFHTQVLGVPSRNLDLFLQGEAGVQRSYAAGAADLALAEGAMGFYDGVGGTDQASAYAVAKLLRLPVILALRPKGASLTLAAQVRGLIDFRPQNQIAALVLTCCTPGLHAHLTPMLERETGLPVLGYLPPMEEAELPSRHLGLYTAGEVAHLQQRFAAVGEQLEKTVALDRLLALAGGRLEEGESSVLRPQPVCTIAVARDEAFCFYYPDNLEALEKAGAKLVFFSPIRDQEPPTADGLYLGGGYPEVYAQKLSENQTMRETVRSLVLAGLPTVAECGGFLYLQKTLEDEQGQAWPMAGALEGAGYRTGRLQRFGYGKLTAQKDSMLFRAGEKIPFHEFHYWDCTQNGTDFWAEKPLGEKSWTFGRAGRSLYAAFPHLHFGGALPLAERFVQRAKEWRENHG